MNVIEASGLGKRYGSSWALRDCSVAVPAGHVAALIGPNGAGKTTLLNVAVGLTAPSAGDLTVLGGWRPGSPGALDGIAFVAQDTPVYKSLSAADMLHLTRNLNRQFDRGYAETRLAELGIPLSRKAGRLSGGQQAQLALTLALARRPRLLVLDEPVAMLDPIARHDFMATVLTAAAEEDVSVLLGGPAIFLWLAGLRLHHAFTAAVACHPVSSPVCGKLVGTFNNIDDFLANGIPLQVLPALIGAFVGAAVLAREMETGTFRFAWTQGFGRWRWAVAKLVLLAVTVTAAAGAFSVLASWYFQPYFATTDPNLGLDGMTPFFAGVFSLHSVTFAAWTLTAFAIGAAAGMLLRRVVPAIAVTLAAYTGLYLATGAYFRPRYLAPLTTTSSDVPGSAWILSQQWLTAGGQPASPSELNQAFQSAGPTQGKPGYADVSGYLVQHGYRLTTSYQPASRFWPFQWIESGWLVALSVLLIAATVALVGRRAT